LDVTKLNTSDVMITINTQSKFKYPTTVASGKNNSCRTNKMWQRSRNVLIAPSLLYLSRSRKKTSESVRDSEPFKNVIFTLEGE
jgi:hypothetical protein